MPLGLTDETVLILLRFAQEGAAAYDDTAAKLDALGAEADVAGASAGSMGDDMEDASGKVSNLGNVAEDAAGSVGGVGVASKDAARDVESGAEDMSGSFSKVSKAAEDARSRSKKGLESISNFGKWGALAVLGIGVASVKMAADYQELLTQLVTGAGESQKNLGMVGSGMLTMSTQVGETADNLAKGMFMIESAGFHGAAGLKVLRASAEGARVGAADMTTVANALTSALNAYHLPASDAVAVTNELVETVASGKMHMQDLASSIGAVLPVAAAAHISFAQVGGALATMTMMGMTAHRAAMNLATTIRALEAPNATAVKEMQDLGLNVNTVSLQLGKKGLTGTMEELSDAILKHMGPSGLMLLNTFNSSKTATADLHAELDAMTPSARALSERLERGQITTEGFTKAMEGMGMQSAAQASSFEALLTKSDSFNSQLSDGGPAAQTYAGALEKLTGNAQALQVALLLTGSHAAAAQNNVDNIADSAKNAGANVQGWALVQKDFNFKMDVLGDTAEAAGIRIGNVLIPALEKLVGWLEDGVEWLEKHKEAAKALAAVLVTVLGFAIGVFMVLKIAKFIEAVGGAMDALKAIMSGNPWMLLVAGLIIAITLIITHWKTVHRWLLDAWHEIDKVVGPIWRSIRDNIVDPILDVVHWLDPLWGLIRRVAVDAFEWIRSHLSIVIPIIVGLITGPIGIMVLEVIRHWKAISDGAKTLWHDVESAFHEIEGVIETVWRVVKPILDAFLKAMNMTVAGVEDVIGIASKVQSAIGGIEKHIPLHGLVGSIFHHVLGEGGIVNRPTLSLIGEKGPEVVIPMNDVNRALQLLQQAGLLSAITSATATGGQGGGPGLGGGGIHLSLGGGGGASRGEFNELMHALGNIANLLTSTLRVDQDSVAAQKGTTAAVVASAGKIVRGITDAVDDSQEDVAQLIARKVR